MDKTALEAAIASKFAAVLQTTFKSAMGNVNYYVANVMDVVGDTARTINVMYYVVDEGEVGEVAYWGNSEPKPTPPGPTFAGEVRAWLQSKIDVTVGSIIIRMFDQLSADNAQGRARVRLTVEDTGTGSLSTIEAALWKVAGQFQYKIITA